MKRFFFIRSQKGCIILAIATLIFLYASISSAESLPSKNKPSRQSLLSPHPASPIEWWYLTGIFDHSGNIPQRGFEATFFRFEVPGKKTLKSPSSPWEINTLISNHATLTDIKNRKSRRFIWMEKTRRTFGKSVSIESVPFEIRLDTSFLRQEKAPGTLHLREEFGGRILDLTLELPQKPLWEAHDHQLITGDGQEDKAFYYSYPEVSFWGKLGNVSDRGVIKWQDVSGKAWFDHEWTKSTLGKNQAGWLWLGLRLKQGDLMAFQMETAKGPDNHRGGTFLFTSSSEKGKVVYLENTDIEITPLDWSRSSKTQICRPKTIRVTVQKLHVEGVVTPVLSEQELAGSPPYWEGAVRFASKEEPGEGYLEMTGRQDPQKCN